MIDSHCHLDDPRYASDLQQVLERARAAGLRGMVSIGCDMATSEAAVAVAGQEPDVWATVGFHPHDSKDLSPHEMDRLRDLARNPRVRAIGEIGLDYHYDHSPRDIQRARFADQLELARQSGLPVVVHSRSAFDDTFSILGEAALPPVMKYAGVLHCFSGGIEEARRALDLGFAISVAGPVTYPASAALRDAVRYIPLDALLVETDAPYLAPQAFRGKRNEPAFVTATVSYIAELRGTTPDLVGSMTAANAAALFGLPSGALEGEASS